MYEAIKFSRINVIIQPSYLHLSVKQKFTLCIYYEYSIRHIPCISCTHRYRSRNRAYVFNGLHIYIYILVKHTIFYFLQYTCIMYFCWSKTFTDIFAIYRNLMEEYLRGKTSWLFMNLKDPKPSERHLSWRTITSDLTLVPKWRFPWLLKYWAGELPQQWCLP